MNPSLSHRTVVALTIIGVVFIGAAGYWYWSAHAHMQARGTAPEIAYPGVIASSSPGFDSYTNAHYGFTLDYPSGWNVGDNELGYGTFQIFNYDEAASAGKDVFPPGENKIEMAIITDLDEYNSDDPNWRGSVEEKQIGGETAMYVSDTANQINSYMIPIPSSGGEYLVMSIYGDPKNFAELDSVAASLHWTAGAPAMTVASSTARWLPAAQLSTRFITPNDTWYWASGGKIYCMNDVVTADYASFEFSSYGEYAKDKDHVYRCTDIVKDADSASFDMIDKAYARDASHIFYSGAAIPAADPATFAIVPGSEPDGPWIDAYGTDASHVFHLGTLLVGADPASFKMISLTGYGMALPADKNWVYGASDGRLAPVSLISDTYARALPEVCMKTDTGGRPTITPSQLPELYSDDYSVIGYDGSSAVCIIDKKTASAEYYPYGWEASVALSRDGSKVLYNVFESEGAAMNGETCADCGTYALDRATGKTSKVSD